MPDLDPEDAKLVTLARSARARTRAAQGAAVRDTDGHQDLERSMITGHRWWTLRQLQTATERIAPSGLAALVERLLHGDIPASPVRLARRR